MVMRRPLGAAPMEVPAPAGLRAEAGALAGSYADLLGRLLDVGEADLREGLRVFQRADALGAFDAVLVAVAQRAGAVALVSADRAFATVPSRPCPTSRSWIDVAALPAG